MISHSCAFQFARLMNTAFERGFQHCGIVVSVRWKQRKLIRFELKSFKYSTTSANCASDNKFFFNKFNPRKNSNSSLFPFNLLYIPCLSSRFLPLFISPNLIPFLFSFSFPSFSPLFSHSVLFFSFLRLSFSVNTSDLLTLSYFSRCVESLKPYRSQPPR